MTEVTEYWYDKQNNVIEKLDALGQRTEYHRDAAGQVKTLLTFNSAGVQTSQTIFTYDAAGNLKSYHDGISSASYEYDSQHRKISETVTYPGFSKSFSYTYSANGLKDTFSMLDGIMYSYSYGDGSLLESITIPNVGDISYPSYTMGRPDNIQLPIGVQQDYSYDPMMRLNGINVEDADENILLDYDYTHDAVSNILTNVTEHGNYRYKYDDVSRLTGVSNPEPLSDESYSYDGVGNRLTASGVSGTISHNQNNELEAYGGISYKYDDNGNMVRKNTGAIAERYVYNVANRLARIEDEATSSLIAEYYYDPFGRRLWKEVNGTRTYFFYSDEGLVAEYDSSGNELRAYGYKPDSLWSTNPLFLKQDDEYFFYQNDHLGTPQKMVDESGTVVWSALYNAFGRAQISVENIENNLRFPGQYYDVESGSHYNLRRFYDSESARYTQTDPIGFNGGDINLYAYVRGNPVTLFDPLGLRNYPFPFNSVVCNYSSDMCLIAYDADSGKHRLLKPGECTSFWFDEGDFAYWNGYWFKTYAGTIFIDDKPVDAYPQSTDYRRPFDPEIDTDDGFKPNSPRKEMCRTYCEYNQNSSQADDLKDMTGGVDACVYTCKHPSYPGDE